MTYAYDLDSGYDSAYDPETSLEAVMPDCEDDYSDSGCSNDLLPYEVPLDPWDVAIWTFSAVGIGFNLLTIVVFLQQGRVTGGPQNRLRLNPALLQLVLLSFSDVLMLIGLIVIRLDLPGSIPRNVYETFLELNAWCTVMIAVTRCFAVTKPFQYFLSTHRTDATKTMILSLLLPIILTIVTEFLNHLAYGNTLLSDDDTCDVETCLKALRWIFALFRFFLPFALILVSAIIISVRLWNQPVRLLRHQSFMTREYVTPPGNGTEMAQLTPRGDGTRRTTSRASTRRNNSLNPAVSESIALVQRITRMSLGVVVMYFVTHILDFILCLHLYQLLDLQSFETPEVVIVNIILLAVNSSSNLFIYLWLSADFKQTLTHLFFCRSLSRFIKCTHNRGGACRRRSTGSTSVSVNSNVEGQVAGGVVNGATGHDAARATNSNEQKAKSENNSESKNSNSSNNNKTQNGGCLRGQKSKDDDVMPPADTDMTDVV